MLLLSMPTLRRAAVPLIAGIAFGAAATALEADPIPQEWLTAQHGSCVKACVASKKSPALCETSCACIDQGFASSMTKADYLAIDTDVKNKTPIPATLSDKIQTIADHCKVGPGQ
jgi:hypothetical protein